MPRFSSKILGFIPYVILRKEEEYPRFFLILMLDLFFCG